MGETQVRTRRSRRAVSGYRVQAPKTNDCETSRKRPACDLESFMSPECQRYLSWGSQCSDDERLAGQLAASVMARWSRAGHLLSSQTRAHTAPRSTPSPSVTGCSVVRRGPYPASNSGERVAAHGCGRCTSQSGSAVSLRSWLIRSSTCRSGRAPVGFVLILSGLCAIGGPLRPPKSWRVRLRWMPGSANSARRWRAAKACPARRRSARRASCARRFTS